MLPTSSARVVIIGGGIIGCSVAYHLGRMGWTDVLLLERHRLSSGSTWHAAGLVGQLRTSANITQLLGYSVELYDRLEQETGLATGWRRVGGLRLACNADRWTEVRRQATTAKSFGLEMHLLSPQEARELWPLMTVEDVVGAAFLPTDGQASPSDITQALAKGARSAGVTIREEVAVTGIEVEHGRVRGVVTDQGRIECERLVICAGLWSRALGKLAGINIPLVPVRHQYVITERIDGVTPGLPTLRDPDRLTYYKEEVGGLVMGGYEPDPIPWAVDTAPPDLSFALIEEDWDHFEQLMTLALGRVPALETAGVKQMISGPESFTPDGNFILGAAPEVRNVYVGCGFNAFGIASAGGAGMALAEWVARGEPPYDLWPVDIRRFGRNHLDEGWVRTRTLEAYAKHYTMAWPAEEYRSGRPLRRSPLYDRLKAQGAVFGEKLGWERPNWFASRGRRARRPLLLRPPQLVRSRRPRASGLPRAGGALRPDLVRQVPRRGPRRRTCPLLDLRQRRGEAAGLAHLHPDAERQGRHRVRPHRGAACGGPVLPRHRHRLRDPRCRLDRAQHPGRARRPSARRDLGQRRAEPVRPPRPRRARRLHARGPLRMPRFPSPPAARSRWPAHPFWPFGSPMSASWGGSCTSRPSSRPRSTTRSWMPAAAHGIANAGYRAIESLRLEKGYRAWGSDIGPDHSPLVAGLAWAVKLGRNTPFLGREALVEQQGRSLPRLLAGFTVDDPAVVLLGRETIYRDGRRAGWLGSAGWGYTVGRNIGYGYVRDPEGVDAAYVLSGNLRAGGRG